MEGCKEGTAENKEKSLEIKNIMAQIRKKSVENLEDKVMDILPEMEQKWHCDGKCKRRRGERAELSTSVASSLAYLTAPYKYCFQCVR